MPWSSEAKVEEQNYWNLESKENATDWSYNSKQESHNEAL